MKKVVCFLVLVVLVFLACSTDNKTASLPTAAFDGDSPFILENVVQTDSSAILDTLINHEQSKHYQTAFLESGQDLVSQLYTGIVNGQHFGLKSSCFDGTIVVYAKVNKEWKAIAKIDEGIGGNSKGFVTMDSNKDKYQDVILLNCDSTRITFLYNPQQRVLEYSK
jgi:hypothetical protein